MRERGPDAMRRRMDVERESSARLVHGSGPPSRAARNEGGQLSNERVRDRHAARRWHGAQVELFDVQ